MLLKTGKDSRLKYHEGSFRFGNFGPVSVSPYSRTTYVSQIPKLGKLWRSVMMYHSHLETSNQFVINNLRLPSPKWHDVCNTEHEPYSYCDWR
jgi:hypothetical protein